jgi:hypothetical protein
MTGRTIDERKPLGSPEVDIHERATPEDLQRFRATARPAQETKSRFGWLRDRPGVIESYVTDKSKPTEAASLLAEKMQFIREMVVALGLDMGIEGLREVHLLATQVRRLSVIREDGLVVDVQTTNLANTQDLAKQILAYDNNSNEGALNG